MTINWTKIILTLIVLFNAGFFLLYGTAKIIGLQLANHKIPADRLLVDCSPTTIMWYFYSIKRNYTILVALAQIVPAILILFKRTRLFGAIFYFFSVTNVLALNLIFTVSRGTLILSAILFVNILLIIFSERQKLRQLFGKTADT